MTTIERAEPILVAGAGGFIGGWLVRHLQEEGFANLRAVDLKPFDEWHQVIPGVDNRVADLRSLDACRASVRGMAHVYNLACDMGGMGFIETNKAACMLSVLINTHLLMAGKDAGVERYFFSSSACVYNVALKQDADVTALQGGRRLSGDARGRLRLGEALLRADVPALPRGLRPRRPAWRATTTSTGPTARRTAVARRRPPRSAAR